ncbi:PucR family transcriptional regulator [Microbacterium sp. cx-55]|uniref:PucR family transcriptional regulator n=1 Tax=Microbacterium sp. cx-55 TaxID=2875948 RepID=UPI001CC0CAD8|nr:PucR family transcriptional regulator [Microbacterium sp. cx-55]MBZ4487917.1 PucR family transcriptional regulator [Microbacterium sp. cx-55]UGB34672.1 PucR family transcriptional regulator [Microbacterium sp. cx-55]
MTAPPVEKPTLDTLLARTDLHLRLEYEGADGSLERRIRGVHSSDLPDPTPFLSQDLALLTTGTQFVTVDDPGLYDEYVQRLRTRGVAALGFGTEVVRDGIPAPLADACRAHGLALFEVPYRTPFIAVARANSETIAAEQYARRSWALAAGRALSLAALRADGLSATLDELSRQLDCWVGLFNATGTLAHERPEGGLAASVAAQLRTEVGTVLRRGARAGSALRIDDVPFTLQTLGRGGHLRGAIAIASGDLDQEARGVVTTVVAMAGLALEQQRSLVDAHTALRAGLAASVAVDESTLPRRVARAVWGGFPAAPVVVGLAGPEVLRRDDALAWLETMAAETGGGLFFGGAAGGMLLLVGADRHHLLGEFAERFEISVGASEPTTLDAVSAGIAQARVARERGGSGLSDFAAVRGSILSVIAEERTRVLAAAELAPLVAHDDAEGTRLVATLRAWLDNDASHESAARALGVHRHTVRARLTLVEQVLGRDLASFAARAELWLALQSLG